MERDARWVSEMSFKGSCLCGAVRYEIDGLDSPIRHCHCQSCRKAQGASYNTSVHVARERFRWLEGEDKLTSYESSPGKFRRFCSICGSPLVAEHPELHNVTVRVATLDEDPGARPAEHIWLSHAAPWLEDSAHMARHEEWYPGR
jgi:ADP-ribosyl-[dinitrogen reductase] hydrolase